MMMMMVKSIQVVVSCSDNPVRRAEQMYWIVIVRCEAIMFSMVRWLDSH